MLGRGSILNDDFSGLSLKCASAVLYRTTFPTKKKKNLNHCMPVSVKGLPLTEFDFET